MSARRNSTCQKHELPKSLEGTEDADVIWSMITERFPNAAPLLREMEAVIDRADDLLQQLKAPHQRKIETTSLHSPASEESVSLVTAQESFIDEHDMEEKVVSQNVAETQISQSTIDEVGFEHYCHISEPQILDQKINNKSLSNFQECALKTTNQASSLEKWQRIVDSTMCVSESNSGNLNNVSIGNSFTSNDYSLARDSGEFSKNCKEDIEEGSRSIKPNADGSTVILHTRTKIDVGDSATSSNYNESGSYLISEDMEAVHIPLQGRGDENSSGFASGQVALDILEKYAERCQVPIVYQYINDGLHRHKSNVYVIRGNLAGFAATSRGSTEECTKNSLALKILTMIVEYQMDDGRLAPLLDLSRDEILEILKLGVDSVAETSQRKLYKLCLEKRAEVPRYCIDKTETCQGFTYVATCTALGYFGEGRGVRECVAKKAAADELYQQYCKDLVTSTMVISVLQSI